MNYAINEIFHSIQGEATYTGTPSAFIRLQGCDVGCPWCDSKPTWDSSDFNHTTESILDEIGTYSCGHVVITGGEPLEQNLSHLLKGLEFYGYSVQIETSGTADLPISLTDDVWITLSPKFNMPNKKEVLHEVILRANEVKMPVGKQKDIETLKNMIEKYHLDVPIYLQPLSLSKKATKLCIETCKKYNWNLSLQTHKYIDER